MEELRLLEQLDYQSNVPRKNELIDENEEFWWGGQEKEAEEQERPRVHTGKTGRILRSRFLVSVQVMACAIVVAGALVIRLFGGAVYESVRNWYVGTVNESIMVQVTKEDLLEIFNKNEQENSDGVIQTAAKTTQNQLAVTYGVDQNAPLSLSVLLQFPVAGGQVSSAFGERADGFHKGLDIAAEMDTPIAAALTGTVKEIGENASYGKYVLLEHGSGIETRYAHCSTVLVKEGDGVKMGMEIAKIGDTGDSSGAHLHLELLVDGTPYNPQSVMR